MSYELPGEVYDELAYDEPAEEWYRYLLSLCGGRSGPILEYACGTGRLTEPFLRAGFSVTAVDRSEAMLNQALRKLRPIGGQLQLACADMEDFALLKPAHIALCICDAVNYLTSREALSRFFAGAYRNLSAGGIFLFDVSSEYRLEHVLGDEFFYDDGENETLFWQNSYDKDSKTCEMNLTVFRADGDAYRRFDEVHVQRAWSEAELGLALSRAGFCNVRAYAFGTRKPPEADTERIQFSAEKGS